MGIDIYMEWDQGTEEEEPHGYIREGYSGGPYATPYLVAEAFEDDHFGNYPTGELMQLMAKHDLDDSLDPNGPGEADYLHPPADERVCHLGDHWWEYPASVLRRRLPLAERIAQVRQREVFGRTSTDAEDVLRTFVELAESIEASGRGPVRILASY